MKSWGLGVEVCLQGPQILSLVPSLLAGPYCRNSVPSAPLLVTNSSTVTVLFNSTSHRSGRGLLVSYATSQHPGMGQHPLGCRDTPGMRPGPCRDVEEAPCSSQDELPLP